MTVCPVLADRAAAAARDDAIGGDFGRATGESLEFDDVVRAKDFHFIRTRAAQFAQPVLIPDARLVR